eukprot:620360-Prymnesium_polylepis.1
MLSHHRVGKKRVPRTWFVNPWDWSRLSFPQPIRPRCGLLGWARFVSESIKRHGLTMDSQGRVAQRSYADTQSSSKLSATCLGICSDRSRPRIPSTVCLGQMALALASAR